MVSALPQIIFLIYRHDLCLEMLPPDKQEQHKKEMQTSSVPFMEYILST